MLTGPRLVQVRGASGSGKSTLVRGFLQVLGDPVRYMDRAAWGLGHVDSPASRPFALGYPAKGLLVPGHYDAPGGGCDMIKKADHAYDIAVRARQAGASVLMEGLFISKEYARLIAQAPDWAQAPLVIYLDLPEPICEESVQLRREALGKERRPLSKHSSDWREVKRAVGRLEAAGLVVERHDRASALARLVEVFA